MKLIRYTEDHHVEIAQWWAAHGAAVIPHNALPAEGVVVQGEKEDHIAAAWLYMDNSAPVALLSWMVVNPTARTRDKFDGLNHCIKFLTGRAEDNGYGALITMSSVSSVEKLMEPHGFSKVAEPASVMMKILK